VRFLFACAALAACAGQAKPHTAVPPRTGDAKVFVTVKLPTGQELRTPIAAADAANIAVPGSQWTCVYEGLFDATTAGEEKNPRFPERVHSVKCSAATYSATTTLACPVSAQGLGEALAARHVSILATDLMLTETTPTGPQLTNVEISCER
jgi:hypothetical protein